VAALIGGVLILASSRHTPSPLSKQGPSASEATAKSKVQPQSAFRNDGFTNSARNAVERYRQGVLNGRFGKEPIEELVRALGKTQGGPDVQLIFQALALRKVEALPLVKEKLRTGEMWEKRMLTKFLGLCPWPETKEELLAVARNGSEHWLPRQGALYALGALGDPSIGPEVVAILGTPGSGVNLQMAAISTLSRIGYKAGAEAIEPFARSDNIHLRLFAIRAQAELGGTTDKVFLLSALRHEDYVARQEASEALWSAEGQDVTDALGAAAQGDFNEAVRDAASQALLRREIAGRNPAEKAEILEKSIAGAGRLTALWILRTVLDEGGASGRRFVETTAERDDFLGERSRAYLMLAESKSR
jgi:hypothetical protein